MEIEFKGEIISGKMNLDNTKMVCIPKHKYQDVDLCLKSDNDKGFNILFAEIKCTGLSYEEKKKIGYEIERRWNSTNQKQ